LGAETSSTELRQKRSVKIQIHSEELRPRLGRNFSRLSPMNFIYATREPQFATVMEKSAAAGKEIRWRSFIEWDLA